MPEQKKQRKKSEPVTTTEQRPEREDVEAELPQAPAKEPLAEPPPIGGTRGPSPKIEPEVE